MDSSKHAPLRINDIRSKYKVIDKVGKGTYGTVFKVLNLQDHKYYAIKKFENTEAKLQVQGFPITALRQISLLKQLNHPNIVNLKQIICSKPNKRNLYRGSTFMVFEYMHHDFAGLFRSKVKFTLPEIKSIMKQLIEGCGFLHQNKVMHRDIKSANILMNDQGIVQVADFGLGRRTRFESVYTYKVVTLWYRAPELLLGCKTYNHKVDVWSIGCVFAELLTGDVLFKKETQYAIIEKIYEICGDLDTNEYTQEYLRGCVYYNDMKPKKQSKNSLASYIRKISPEIESLSIDFLQGLLELNPYKRLSCEQALQHDFFKRQPKACAPQSIQKLDVEYHEMFRDRSLKIQRKERKLSLDWSEEEEKQKGKEEPKQQKSYKTDEKCPKPYQKNERDPQHQRNYERNRFPTNRDERYAQNRYDQQKREYSSSYKKFEAPKHHRKYSRSASHSRTSSSSSSRSKRSRTRDKKKHHRYENREQRKPYRKEVEHDKKQQAMNSKKDNGNHSYPEKDQERYRESQKDRQYRNENKWAYKRDAIPYKEQKSYKDKTYESKDKTYESKDKTYESKDKTYESKERDIKSSDRKQLDEKRYEFHRGTSRYPKDREDKLYSRSSPKDKYEEAKSKSYTKQQPCEFRPQEPHRNYDKGQVQRDSKPYNQRESKQHTKKQFPPSQKYPQNKRHYRSPQKQRQRYNDREHRKDRQFRNDRQYRHDREHRTDRQYRNDRQHRTDRNDRQYREYQKPSNDYPRKQSRHKDDSRYKEDSRSYKNVSLQRQRSIDRKKHSPRKNMDIQTYY